MDCFKNIVGYKDIIKHFQQAIILEKLSHAYIIEGTTGMGKKLLAGTIAKTILCETQHQDACNQCQSCRLYESNNHPDIVHVLGRKKTGIGVDDIREYVNEDVSIKPYMSEQKVYVLHEAERMTLQAQNALLKTLEAPPSYVRFFLLAKSSHSFLPTILSRCVVVKLKPQSEAVIRGYLEHTLFVPKASAKLYAAFARGSIGQAIALKDSEEFSVMRQEIISFMDVVVEGRKIDILEAIEIFKKYEDQKLDFLDMLLTWIRDLMVIKSTEASSGLIHHDQIERLLNQALHISYNRMSQLVEGIEEMFKYHRLHINYLLLVEVMLIKMLRQR